jgi:hypothetical protein
MHLRLQSGMFNVIFGGYYLRNNRRECAACFVLASCLASFMTLKIEAVIFSEISVTSTKLHDVAFKKILLFIVATVRTSNAVPLLKSHTVFETVKQIRHYA